MQLEIVLIEAFFSGSHEQWARSLKKYSTHAVELLTLPGRHWKWRMHGGAISCARLFLERFGRQHPRATPSGATGGESGEKGDAAGTDASPQILLATDMFDLTSFLALTRARTAGMPVALYFHENQFSYPARDGAADSKSTVLETANPEAAKLKRDEHYAFINYASALAADRIFFNSRYHCDDFLKHVREFPRRFPDWREEAAADSLETKSRVLSLGLDLPPIASALAPRSSPDARTGGQQTSNEDFSEGPPVILWNHRREHDKNPEDFFGVLFALKARGVRFQLVVLGQAFRESPPIFERARSELKQEMLRFEPARDRAEYMQWLAASDICPVTSHHDFFGAAVVEAMAAGCYPLLPRRLAYPEHVGGQARFLYDDKIELLNRLEAMLKTPADWRNSGTRREIAALAARHDWSRRIGEYDREFEELYRDFAQGAGSDAAGSS